MLKRSLVVLAGLCILAAAPSASAAGRTCPAAFQTLTIEQAVKIKIALGYPLTPEELEAALGVLTRTRMRLCAPWIFRTRFSPRTSATCSTTRREFRRKAHARTRPTRAAPASPLPTPCGAITPGVPEAVSLARGLARFFT